MGLPAKNLNGAIPSSGWIAWLWFPLGWLWWLATPVPSFGWGGAKRRMRVRDGAWRCRDHGDDRSCAEPSPPTPLPAGEGFLQLNFNANQALD